MIDRYGFERGILRERRGAYYITAMALVHETLSHICSPSYQRDAFISPIFRTISVGQMVCRCRGVLAPSRQVAQP
jgi:hypothetical protein